MLQDTPDGAPPPRRRRWRVNEGGRPSAPAGAALEAPRQAAPADVDDSAPAPVSPDRTDLSPSQCPICVDTYNVPYKIRMRTICCLNDICSACVRALQRQRQPARVPTPDDPHPEPFSRRCPFCRTPVPNDDFDDIITAVMDTPGQGDQQPGASGEPSHSAAAAAAAGSS
ncbi:unnamed protein product [Vitrella brassicaformis CCMP3155]|uniref:RING-type domain-containing protein n=1 Tax=Vitrella brassicaformis (strain CCMP3155) TaxID=1169540 RepID=A0A0G4H2D8_VITBC|nr:unnamed protein product [Vitrella brassicaformis CCMP3155]|mmetsp:Transcript_36477/g.91191  ORF Transcript_36477/g.91191 Transcript_36477/m.91191 type:complete len:170 (+) Transcript_36477:83-592(+)|eukprot:CEM37732.1 unnamed protein product [Vitrella brassicaformis CCMP3155]